MHAIAKILSNFLPPKLIKTAKSIRRKIQVPLKWTNRFSTIDLVENGRFKILYRKETIDEIVLNSSFDHDIFFSGVPEYKPGHEHIIIDIGAHIGTFALLASSKVPNGRVFAIEASEDSFNLLRLNVALNNAYNIFVHHLAISGKTGTCKLYYNAENWGHTIVKPLSEQVEEVNCCTLSHFLNDNGISKCHFLKLNCEGAEFPIILNSSHDVLQRIDTILVLYHCDFWTENSEEDLISHLKSSGFQTEIRNRSGNRGWIIATKP